MTDKKLTQLSTGTTIVTGDLVYSAPQAGGQVKQPVSAISTYVAHNGASTAGTGFIGDLGGGFGNFAIMGQVTLSPGDPTNQVVHSPLPSPAISNAYTSGDLSTNSQTSGLLVYPGYKHTGASGALILDVDIEGSINSDSTGPINGYGALLVGASNYGSGNITTMEGLEGAASHFGTGNVSLLYGMSYEVVLNGTVGTVGTAYGAYISSFVGTNQAVSNLHGFYVVAPVGGGIPTKLTNLRGLYIEDHAGKATTISENIRSAGATSINTFEGVVNLSPHAFAALPSSPQNGMIACVNNSSVATWGGTANGSGSTKVLVWYNGTNWTVIGA